MLSIIIPTKNEPYIGQLVRDIKKKIRMKHEIIVVDKSDELPKIRGAKLILQKSDGLGNAVLEGIATSKGNVIVMMDGDGSHEPACINEMARYIKKYDIVIGSRYARGGSTEDSFSRCLISKFFNGITALFLGLKIKDTMSGFAMYRRGLFTGLALRPRGYKLLLEVAYKGTKQRNAKIKEIPIHFHKRKSGKSKVGFNLKGFKEALRIILTVISLKFGVK